MEIAPREPPKLTGPAATFGAHIRELREAQGIRLNAFYRRLGLTSGYGSQFERGLAAPPGEAVIIQMAEILKVNVDLLLSRAGRIRTGIMAKLWSGGLMVGPLSQATGLDQQSVQQIVANVAAFYEGKGDDAA